MKTHAVVGWTWNADTWCTMCAEHHPDYEKMDDPEYDGGPIFADTESDRILRCADCGTVIENSVTLRAA